VPCRVAWGVGPAPSLLDGWRWVVEDGRAWRQTTEREGLRETWLDNPGRAMNGLLRCMHIRRWDLECEFLARILHVRSVRPSDSQALVLGCCHHRRRHLACDGRNRLHPQRVRRWLKRRRVRDVKRRRAPHRLGWLLRELQHPGGRFGLGCDEKKEGRNERRRDSRADPEHGRHVCREVRLTLASAASGHNALATASRPLACLSLISCCNGGASNCIAGTQDPA
jgi:hypothetical protein